MYNNKQIQNSKTNYSKLIFLKKNYEDFKICIDQIWNKNK